MRKVTIESTFEAEPPTQSDGAARAEITLVIEGKCVGISLNSYGESSESASMTIEDFKRIHSEIGHMLDEYLRLAGEQGGKP